MWKCPLIISKKVTGSLEEGCSLGLLFTYTVAQSAEFSSHVYSRKSCQNEVLDIWGIVIVTNRIDFW